MPICIQCSKQVEKASYQYCSNKCQLDFQYQEYISQWKQGNVNGSRGIYAKNISGHVKRYLLDKYGRACSVCGWCMINETTGRVPLEIDHIDGNADNNAECNLRMIYPNCHSLTSSYRNLNRGMGRSWKREKYLKS